MAVVGGVLGGAAAQVSGTVSETAAKLAREAARAFTGLGDALRDLRTALSELLPLQQTAAKAFAAIADALKPLTDKLRFVADVIKFTVTGALDAFGDKLKGVFGKIDPETALKPLTRGLTGIGRAAGVAVAGLAVVGGALAVIGTVAQQFVQKANPVVAEQFTLAVNDLMAVMGQALVPVFKIVTDLVRAVADTFMGFAKDIGSMVGQLLEPFAQVLKEIFSVIGLIGKGIVAVLQPIVTIAAAVLKLIADIISKFMRFVESVLGLFGIEPGRKEGAAAGAAARSASTTDVESVLRSAREKAFSLGIASEDPSKKTINLLEVLRDIGNRMLDALVQLPAKLARAIRDGATAVVESSTDSIGDRVDSLALEARRAAGRAAGLTDSPFDAVRRRAEEFRKAVGGDSAGVVTGGDF